MPACGELCTEGGVPRTTAGLRLIRRLRGQAVHVMSTHRLFRIGGRVMIPAALLCARVLGISTAAAATITAGAPVQAPDYPFAGTSTACDNLIAQQTAPQ